MTITKKTLLITQDFPPLTGGVANYYWNRVSKMPANEVVVLMNKIPNSRFQIPDSKFQIYYKRFFTKLIWPHWLPLIWQAWKIIKKEKPDMVWVGQVLPVGTAVWILKWLVNHRILRYAQDDILFKITCHGNDLIRARQVPRKCRLAKKILADAEVVEANTRFTQEILIKDFNLPASKIKIVYPECSLSRNMINQRKVAELQKKYNLAGKKVLLTVARLVKSKGIEKIIKLMPDLIKEISGLVYIVIGEGPERNNLGGTGLDLSINNKIIFVGNILHEDLPNYYALADCFVLVPDEKSGDTESFGIVYLEALEFDLPVIAGNVGGAKEIANKNINLVDSENLDEIKENILKILK